jgi:hypothetical protein
MPEKLLALLGPRESNQFSNTLLRHVTAPSHVRDQIITIVTFTFIAQVGLREQNHDETKHENRKTT